MRNLFEPHKPPESVPGPAAVFAEVAFNLPLEGTYTYLVPERLAGLLAPGMRVEAPLGPRRVVGYCVALTGAAPEGVSVKEIISVVDSEPLVDAHMLELTRWVAERYFAGWGEALEAALPAGVRFDVGTRTVVTLSVAPEDARAEADKWGRRAPKRRAALEALIASDSAYTVTGSGGRGEGFHGDGHGTHQLRPCRHRPRAATRQGAPRAGAGLQARLQTRARAEVRARRGAAGPGGEAFRADPSVRSHRQRQDGGLPAGDRGRGARRAAGGGAHPRDKPHAADGEPLPRALRQYRRPPQPPRRREAPSRVAEDSSPARPTS